MRIYVAGPWLYKAEAAAAGAALEAAGHTITKKWWEHREVPGYLSADISQEELRELIQQAQEDLNGVQDAEVFVLLNRASSEGKAVETGYMLMSEDVDRMFLVGPKSNIFHYLHGWEEVPTVQDVITALQQEMSA